MPRCSAGRLRSSSSPRRCGGPGHLKALRDPFPTSPSSPSAGSDSTRPGPTSAGAVGAGVGGPLVGDAASGGSLDALRRPRAGIRRLGRRTRGTGVTVTSSPWARRLAPSGRRARSARPAAATPTSPAPSPTSRSGWRGSATPWGGSAGSARPFGEAVLRTLRGEGVSTVGAVVVDETSPTGLMFLEQRTADLSRVQYCVRDRPARRLSAGGPAGRGDPVRPRCSTSPGSPRAVAGRRCRPSFARPWPRPEAGVRVSLDVNHRTRLWSREDASPVLRRCCPTSGWSWRGRTSSTSSRTAPRTRRSRRFSGWASSRSPSSVAPPVRPLHTREGRVDATPSRSLRSTRRGR